ncbi:RNA recognition motif domain-containing protein [Dinghuibacter silviterrae]|uniref:RNA recognition motif-containing protein n=1 Tax=Dinghuibacter silviterrae TaxID=1539049 RepID=A0A4R8DW58_9BACT|nr:RNA-binding protein [Dinghuibacter silviterrae]TDX01451.1 RNA recognition motif-containing protein [Dinghuibacter silviterrae]
MTLYVSNLAFQVTDRDLQSLFTPFGAVNSINIIMDKATGRSRGFAFVEIPDAAGENAIRELQGVDLQGRPLSIAPAKPKRDESDGGFQPNRNRNRF